MRNGRFGRGTVVVILALLSALVGSAAVASLAGDTTKDIRDQVGEGRKFTSQARKEISELREDVGKTADQAIIEAGKVASEVMAEARDTLEWLKSEVGDIPDVAGEAEENLEWLKSEVGDIPDPTDRFDRRLG